MPVYSSPATIALLDSGILPKLPKAPALASSNSGALRNIRAIFETVREQSVPGPAGARTSFPHHEGRIVVRERKGDITAELVTGRESEQLIDLATVNFDPQDRKHVTLLDSLNRVHTLDELQCELLRQLRAGTGEQTASLPPSHLTGFLDSAYPLYALFEDEVFGSLEYNAQFILRGYVRTAEDNGVRFMHAIISSDESLKDGKRIALLTVGVELKEDGFRTLSEPANPDYYLIRASPKVQYCIRADHERTPEARISMADRYEQPGSGHGWTWAEVQELHQFLLLRQRAAGLPLGITIVGMEVESFSKNTDVLESTEEFLKMVGAVPAKDMGDFDEQSGPKLLL